MGRGGIRQKSDRVPPKRAAPTNIRSSLDSVPDSDIEDFGSRLRNSGLASERDIPSSGEEVVAKIALGVSTKDRTVAVSNALDAILKSVGLAARKVLAEVSDKAQFAFLSLESVLNYFIGRVKRGAIDKLCLSWFPAQVAKLLAMLVSEAHFEALVGAIIRAFLGVIVAM